MIVFYMRISQILATFFLLCAGASLSAYEIGSGGSFERARSLDLHETITELALECLRRAEGRPKDCSDLHSEIRSRSTQNRPTDTTSLTYAVRWPDDPLRILDQTITQVRFVYPILSECEPAFQEGTAINRTGLLCASHFGRMQFMHAMMSDEAPENIEQQRQLILAWADFAFRASTDTEFASQDYCEVVSDLENADLRDALTFDNATERGSFCKKRRHPILFWRTYPPWKVSSLFAFSCEEPFNLRTCGTVHELLARQAAAGAVLHLIQDSFSQSHASRQVGPVSLPPRGPFHPIIVCEEALAFYNYRDQVGEPDVHKPADLLPEQHDVCRSDERDVDDIITATANAMYFLFTADRNGFYKYISERVFPQVSVEAQ